MIPKLPDIKAKTVTDVVTKPALAMVGPAVPVDF